MIIGKLIPAGTGFDVYTQKQEALEASAAEDEELLEETAVDFSGALIDDNTDDSILEAIAAAVAAETGNEPLDLPRTRGR